MLGAAEIYTTPLQFSVNQINELWLADEFQADASKAVADQCILALITETRELAKVRPKSALHKEESIREVLDLEFSEFKFVDV